MNSDLQLLECLFLVSNILYTWINHALLVTLIFTN